MAGLSAKTSLVSGTNHRCLSLARFLPVRLDMHLCLSFAAPYLLRLLLHPVLISDGRRPIAIPTCVALASEHPQAWSTTDGPFHWKRAAADLRAADGPRFCAFLPLTWQRRSQVAYPHGTLG